MSKNKKQKSNKKFELLGQKIGRRGKNRNERTVKDELPLMQFSFKDFQYNSQIPPGQTYKEWEEKGLLAYMLTKFGYICNVNRIEAVQQKYIKIYGSFPLNSKFKNPFPDTDLDWGVVLNIKGQKPRVVGYVVGHIFYVIFLDLEHQFFPSNKKNT